VRRRLVTSGERAIQVGRLPPLVRRRSLGTADRLEEERMSRPEEEGLRVPASVWWWCCAVSEVQTGQDSTVPRARTMRSVDVLWTTSPANLGQAETSTMVHH
jgi:hypothetical protein